MYYTIQTCEWCDVVYEWTFVKTRSNKVAQWCPYNDFGTVARKTKHNPEREKKTDKNKKKRWIPLKRTDVVFCIFFLSFSSLKQMLMLFCFVFILNRLVCYCIMHFFVCLPNILNLQFGLGATVRCCIQCAFVWSASDENALNAHLHR